MQTVWNYLFGKLPRKEKENYNGLEKNTKSSTEFRVTWVKEQIQRERLIMQERRRIFGGIRFLRNSKALKSRE